jgi:hypothetical protein
LGRRPHQGRSPRPKFDLNGEAEPRLTSGGKAGVEGVVRGNPATNIRDIRNVQLVFKDGVGYDPAKLIESVRGLVGEK